MNMRKDRFRSLVHTAIAATPIGKSLAETDAVILERVARAAGATNWYYCSDETRLEAAETELSPGSVVSFYFDNRIKKAPYSPSLRPIMEKIIAETRAVVFGLLDPDGLHLNVEYVDNPTELAKVTSGLDSTVNIFYGEFPDRDNDGVKAVTLTLPDKDGIVRAHPH